MSESRLNRRELIRAGAGITLAAYGLGGLSGCTVERPIDKSAAAEVVVPGIDGDLHRGHIGRSIRDQGGTNFLRSLPRARLRGTVM